MENVDPVAALIASQKPRVAITTAPQAGPWIDHHIWQLQCNGPRWCLSRRMVELLDMEFAQTSDSLATQCVATGWQDD